MRKNIVDIFLKTGKAKCIHHGLHSEWKFIDRKSKETKGKIYPYKTIECRKCARERTKKFNKNNPSHQDNYRYSFDGLIVRMVSGARVRSRKRKHPFELDIKWAKEQLVKQNNKCVYSGIEFDFSRPSEKAEKRPYIPSIDQKVPGLGYTKNNSVIVCSIVNMMKNELHLNDFVNICGRIVTHLK